MTNLNKLVTAETQLTNALNQINNVISLITNLPSTANLTLDNEAAVNAARTAYNNLDTLQKARVSNYSKLVDLEQRIQLLYQEVANVETLINALPGTITLTHETQVQEARLAYDALTTAQKSKVTNLNKLVTAETQLTNTLNRVRNVEILISNLPNQITLEHLDQFNLVQDAYDSLTVIEQDRVLNRSLLTDSSERINSLYSQIDSFKLEVDNLDLNNPNLAELSQLIQTLLTELNSFDSVMLNEVNDYRIKLETKLNALEWNINFNGHFNSIEGLILIIVGVLVVISTILITIKQGKQKHLEIISSHRRHIPDLI